MAVDKDNSLSPLDTYGDKPVRVRSAGEKMKDPIRCPMCLKTLMCPRSKDLDEFLRQVNIKCISSDESVCSQAVKNPCNAKYVATLQASQSSRR